MKKVFDLISSLIGFIFFLPLFLIISLIIKLSSPGPIFFKQRRIGKDNEEFYILKFRTMRIDTPNVATHLLENPDKYIFVFFSTISFIFLSPLYILVAATSSSKISFPSSPGSI